MLVSFLLAYVDYCVIKCKYQERQVEHEACDFCKCKVLALVDMSYALSQGVLRTLTDAGTPNREVGAFLHCAIAVARQVIIYR